MNDDTTLYVIVDKDNIPLENELEVTGIVIFENEYDAADCIEWLIQDWIGNAYRGLRIEIYDRAKHEKGK